jgi:hypothetical protein
LESDSRRGTLSLNKQTVVSRLLPRLLTLDAVVRPRNGFQSLRLYIFTALGTLAEGAPPDAFEGLPQHSAGLACSRSFVRESLSFELFGSLVSGIGVLSRKRSRLLLCICENTLQFRNTGFESLLEALDFVG